MEIRLKIKDGDRVIDTVKLQSDDVHKLIETAHLEDTPIGRFLQSLDQPLDLANPPPVRRPGT